MPGCSACDEPFPRKTGPEPCAVCIKLDAAPSEIEKQQIEDQRQYQCRGCGVIFPRARKVLCAACIEHFLANPSTLPLQLKRDESLWNLIKPLSNTVIPGPPTNPQGQAQPPASQIPSYPTAHETATGITNLALTFKEGAQPHRVTGRPMNSSLQQASASKLTQSKLNAEKFANKLYLRGQCIVFKACGYMRNAKGKLEEVHTVKTSTTIHNDDLMQPGFKLILSEFQNAHEKVFEESAPIRITEDLVTYYIHKNSKDYVYIDKTKYDAMTASQMFDSVKTDRLLNDRDVEHREITLRLTYDKSKVFPAEEDSTDLFFSSSFRIGKKRARASAFSSDDEKNDLSVRRNAQPLFLTESRIRPAPEIRGVRSYSNFLGPWITLRVKQTKATAQADLSIDLEECDEEVELQVARDWRRVDLQSEWYGSGFISDGGTKRSIYGRIGDSNSFAINQHKHLGHNAADVQKDLINEAKIMAIGAVLAKDFDAILSKAVQEGILKSGECKRFAFNTEEMFLGEVMDEHIPSSGPDPNDDGPVLLYNHFIATRFLPHNKLETGFRKYTGNDGILDKELVKDPLALVLDAFQHYSIEITKNGFMLCDLQGIRGHRIDRRIFFLIDPQAHSSKKGTFGHCDLGPASIDKYLKHHVCNKLCCAVGLKSIAN